MKAKMRQMFSLIFQLGYNEEEVPHKTMSENRVLIQPLVKCLG